MQGRSIDIQGIGIEALLDWKIVPTWASSIPGYMPEQISLLGFTIGIPSATSGSVPGPQAQSSLAFPIGGFTRGAGDATAAVMIPSSFAVGVPFRQLIQTVVDSVTKFDQQPALSGATQIRVLFTIDFYGQLRMWNDYPTTEPSDYLSDSFDVTASAFVENLEFTTDPSQIVHEVWVTGSGAAATPTLYDDGTGVQGRQMAVTDTTITTASGARQAAQAVFQANSNQVRGSYERNDWDPTTAAGQSIRAGSLVTMVDPSVSLNAPVNGYRIMEIEKTFNGSGRQNWKVSFGSLAPSAIRDIRRLTRQTLN
jgi:hypothetical protein